MTRRVVVDWGPDSASRFRDAGWAVVVVDVIRASTTAVTAASLGHRCYPVASVEDAHRVAALLDDPILAGEVEGERPHGFHIQNSPTAISRLAVRNGGRDLVLLSTSGTRLMATAMDCDMAFVASLRNTTAQVVYLADGTRDVAVLGAGSNGVFRKEDQLCCTSIAQGLVDRGFEPTSDTPAFLERWRGVPSNEFLDSDSVEYLRRTDQIADLEFVLSHVDDLDDVFPLEGGRVVRLPSPGAPRTATASG